MDFFADLVVLAFQRGEARALDDRNLVARELIFGQQLAHLELDQVEQLGVVDHVDLVEEHHQRRHANLASE